MDRHYKILRIANATPLTSINLQVDDALVGDFIQSEYITYYKALIESFEIINKYESAINQLYLSIELVEDSGRLDFVIKSRHGNVVYNIQDIEHKLKEKVNKLVSVPSDGFYNTSINIYVSNNQVIAEKIS